MTEAISLSKQDIRKLTVAQLKDWLTQHGEQGFRAKQIVEWLWKNLLPPLMK